MEPPSGSASGTGRVLQGKPMLDALVGEIGVRPGATEEGRPLSHRSCQRRPGPNLPPSQAKKASFSGSGGKKCRLREGARQTVGVGVAL